MAAQRSIMIHVTVKTNPRYFTLSSGDIRISELLLFVFFRSVDFARGYAVDHGDPQVAQASDSLNVSFVWFLIIGESDSIGTSV